MTPAKFDECMKVIAESRVSAREKTTAGLFVMVKCLRQNGFGAGIEKFEKAIEKP